MARRTSSVPLPEASGPSSGSCLPRTLSALQHLGRMAVCICVAPPGHSLADMQSFCTSSCANTCKGFCEARTAYRVCDSVCCRGEALCQGICSSAPEPPLALRARLPRQLCLEGGIPVWLQNDEEGAHFSPQGITDSPRLAALIVSADTEKSLRRGTMCSVFLCGFVDLFWRSA